MINSIMKIHEIINETCSGGIASVAMPMTPGTSEKEAHRSVYGPQSKSKKKKSKPGYNNPVNSPMIKR